MNPIRIRIGSKQSLDLMPIEIKTLLRRAGITINELAARIGHSRGAVSKAINGSTGFPKLRIKLAAELERIANEPPVARA
jgi:DNA transposition AAA+ family ATPase